MDIYGQIPELTGSVCEALIKQDYWCQGEKCADPHILFLKIKNGKWQRFFFDAGTLCWSEAESPDIYDPALWAPDPDDYFFPQTEIGNQTSLIGQTIENIDTLQHPELRIRFSEGITLILKDLNSDDHQVLEFTKDSS